MPEIGISKIEAAKGQLETAIDLFFKDRDIVSIHTLAAAAHEILHQISSPQGVKGIIKDLDLVKPEYKRVYMDKVKEAENFFKHSGKDQKKIYLFNPETTEIFIYDACSMYRQLTKENPKMMLIFSAWFAIKLPEMFIEQKVKEGLNAAAKYTDINNRPLFFKEFSDLYDRMY